MNNGRENSYYGTEEESEEGQQEETLIGQLQKQTRGRDSVP